MIRWDPFCEMLSVRDAMGRLFDNALGSMPEDWQPAWNLALDVAENANEFVVKASVPGLIVHFYPVGQVDQNSGSQGRRN
jgi:HSP20 family molecular chaperone IbpA